MWNFMDPTGKNGLRKRSSPKSLLEFYSEKKGLNWFDRNQETYVQGWRIKENIRWTGKDAIKIAIESIEDVLYRDSES